MKNIDWDAVERGARTRAPYWVETAVLEFTAQLSQVLREKSVSQHTLAERVGKKPAFISRVLNGAHNMTIRTMVELVHALGMRLKISVEPAQESVMHAYEEVQRSERVVLGTWRNARQIRIAQQDEYEQDDRTAA